MGVFKASAILEVLSCEVLFPPSEEETTFMELCRASFGPHLMLETTFSRKLNRHLQVDGIFHRRNGLDE